MKTETIIRELKQYQNPQGLRAYCQFWYLDSISKARGDCYEQMLRDAGTTLLEKARGVGTVTAKLLEEFETELQALAPVAKEYTYHLVSHAHIDMNWMWGYHETVATTLETFRTVLRMMEEYPDFTYAQSQASVYRIVEKYEPEMLEEIRRRVKEKRWEVTASTWVEGDKNMASGEAQCRQIQKTKQYLSKLLDIDPNELRLDYEPDTFGHTIYEPEILQSAGVDYLYHCRGCDQRDIYRWRAPSGKEILVFQEPKWYNGTMSPIYLADYPTYCAGVAGGKLRDVLVVYGVGDHGGGPTRRDIETIIDLQSWPLFPVIKFGRYDTYFRAIEALREDLPVYEGESNFIFDGCYTSQSRLKMANSLSEKRLYDADALAALADLKDEEGLLEEAWEHTLFNQFHDILPGSCVIDSREWSMGKFQEVLAAANTVSNKALRQLTGKIDTSCIDFDDNRLTNSEGAGIGFNMSNEALYPFSFTERGKGSTRIWHIFNTTEYDREEFTEVKVWDYPGDIRNITITDAAGNALPFQITVENRNYMGMHKVSQILVKAKVAAFGYTTCILRQNPEAQPAAKLAANCNGPRREWDLGDRAYVLENAHIYCEFDPVTCALVSMKDKKTGLELAGENAACFEYVEENPRFSMTSWRVGPAMKKVNLNKAEPVRVTKYTQGAALSVLEYTIKFRSSILTTQISLDSEQRYLDFYVTVDWIETEQDRTVPALRFLLNPGYASEHFRYSVASGTIVRQELPHDVPSLGTMEFLPETRQAAHLMLFSDYKYGFRGNREDCGVHLLRSSDSPDPRPELGRHHTHIYVGVVCDGADAARMAKCVAHAMPAVSGYAHPGTLPLCGKLLEYQGSCAVTAVKNGVAGGKVVRLFNAGDREETVVLGATGEAFVTDSAELTAEPIPVKDGKAVFAVAAHSYQTVLLK